MHSKTIIIIIIYEYANRNLYEYTANRVIIVKNFNRYAGNVNSDVCWPAVVVPYCCCYDHHSLGSTAKAQIETRPPLGGGLFDVNVQNASREKSGYRATTDLVRLLRILLDPRNAQIYRATNLFGRTVESDSWGQLGTLGSPVRAARGPRNAQTMSHIINDR